MLEVVPMRSWDAPIVDNGVDWPLQLVSHYDWLIRVVDGVRHDALAARAWEAALRTFDRRPEPTTVEAQNARWRELVAEVWDLWDRYQARVERQRLVQARRRAA